MEVEEKYEEMIAENPQKLMNKFKDLRISENSKRDKIRKKSYSN